MVTDFCPGGELFFHLHNLGRFTEDQAKFYFCEILLAIEYLHHERIIFRDLKPENTLIDVDGHIKLVDFGLAKEDTGTRFHSFCGSHEYLSPEMIKRNGYNRNVDFYSLGSFLYEMLTGLPPFWDNDRNNLYYKILNEDLVMPRFLSREVQSLMKGLLRKDPSLRLGSILGTREIKNHPWLENVNWDLIAKKKVVPPFRPNSTKSNFETEFLSLSIKDSVFFKADQQTSEYDPVFQDFNYSTLEKSKNHELVVEYEEREDETKSKSFIEVTIRNTSLKYFPVSKSAQKETYTPSQSLSPIKHGGKKLGPELLSVKVAPKFTNSVVSQSKKAKKTMIKPCNRSFISTRQSMRTSKLDMD